MALHPTNTESSLDRALFTAAYRSISRDVNLRDSRVKRRPFHRVPRVQSIAYRTDSVDVEFGTSFTSFLRECWLQSTSVFAQFRTIVLTVTVSVFIILLPPAAPAKMPLSPNTTDRSSTSASGSRSSNRCKVITHPNAKTLLSATNRTTRLSFAELRIRTLFAEKRRPSCSLNVACSDTLANAHKKLERCQSRRHVTST